MAMPLSKDSLDAALWAVGGTLAGSDAVVDGNVSRAFCVVRPSGHHATRTRGMGFCIFDNVAALAGCPTSRVPLAACLPVLLPRSKTSSMPSNVPFPTESNNFSPSNTIPCWPN